MQYLRCISSLNITSRHPWTCRGFKTFHSSVNFSGFDTETTQAWNASRASQTPSLVQIATSERAVLFQLGNISKSTMDVISNILGDEKIIKAGVGIESDVLYLQKWAIPTCTARGIVDLRRILQPFDVQAQSLSSLTALLLHERVGGRRQRGSWARKRLTQSQQKYAAMDAQLGARLYSVLHIMFPEHHHWAPPRTLLPSNIRFRGRQGSRSGHRGGGKGGR
ncbi:hypothetical protein AAMO2058_000068900 [Amorphochlora amoebiformis]